MNTPLSGSKQMQVLFFFMITLLLCLPMIGIPIIIIVALGVIAMKRSHDFSAMMMAFKISKLYMNLCLIGGLFSWFAVIFYEYKSCVEYIFCDNDWLGVSTVGAISLSIYLIYHFLFNYWFIKPLTAHQYWVEKNGIFSNELHNINIKTDNFKSYSAADELQKWIKLREEGLISEEELQKIKEKLLK